jgi:hypothetical protein
VATFRINIEVLENGFEVEIPDVEAFNKAEADAKKNKGKNAGMACSPYPGDFMKGYAAKTVDEVLALLKPALKKLPQQSYDEAFAEAAAAENE